MRSAGAAEGLPWTGIAVELSENDALKKLGQPILVNWKSAGKTADRLSRGLAF